jgi:hypothetical protein
VNILIYGLKYSNKEDFMSFMLLLLHSATAFYVLMLVLLFFFIEDTPFCWLLGFRLGAHVGSPLCIHAFLHFQKLCYQ